METVGNGSSPSVPGDQQQAQDSALLYVDGLVAAPRALTVHELAALGRVTVTEDFVCENKPTELDQGWSGVSLLAILQLAQPLPQARFVRVHADGYSVPVALDEIEMRYWRIASMVSH